MMATYKFETHPEGGSHYYVEAPSLQSLCISTICKHQKRLCVPVRCRCSSDPVSDRKFCSTIDSCRFSNTGLKLFSSLAEDLLHALCRSKLITNGNMNIFNGENTQLHRVILDNVSVGTCGLRVLRDHRLVELQGHNIGSSLEMIMSDQVISEPTKHSLRVLKISGCIASSFEVDTCLTMATMSKIATTFRNLMNLSLCNVNLQNDGLTELCMGLSPTVTSLDISDNPITDISPISRLGGHLRSLSMYNLYSLTDTGFYVLTDELPELRHLDISCDTGQQLEAYLHEGVSPIAVDNLLCAVCLPKLVSLDVSGREIVTAKHVRQFLSTHPDLQFMGLAMTPASHSDQFVDKDHQYYIPSLQISSLASEAHVLDCLARYRHRHFFVQRALVALFQLTSHMVCEPRYDFIEAILDVMQHHLEALAVQMAATACLYNLTKNEMGNNVHVVCLSRIVGRILDCMARYPTNEQLQKNSLLSLCTDRILMDVNFDRFRCAKLIMECLCKFEDDAMVRMSVAIISILAAKVSTQETSELAANTRYMTRLIEITKLKMSRVSVDCTMKFVLSALWNLTDESPLACHCFLNLDGVELAISCLAKYSKIEDQQTRLQIQTKVVGLLNNIAEVDELKRFLITEEFITMMRESLRSSYPEFSYFSGGILANLLSETRNPAWDDLGPTYELLQDEMMSVISEWRQPESAMVAYRCFRPFFPLLNLSSPPAVKYWALWAIEHVCMKSPERYVGMLIKEGIYSSIVRLIECDTGAPKLVRDIAQNLHQFISSYGRQHAD